MFEELIIFLAYSTAILCALTLCGLIADYVLPAVERRARTLRRQRAHRKQRPMKGGVAACPKC